MSSRSSRPPLVASLLDRLLDDAPDERHEPADARSLSIDALRAAVRRDLEELLNTRQPVLSLPAALTEVQRSVLAYGLPDPSALPLGGKRQQESFLRTIEAVIRRHEPRFKRVAVVATGEEQPDDRVLRFRIEALLHAEPAPLPVQFDSSVEPVQRNVKVHE